MLAGRSLNSAVDRILNLNRVFDEALASSWNGASGSHVWLPALDVVERRDAYLITFDIPGVDPSTLDISFEQNVLTVRGNKPFGGGLDASSNSEVRVYSAERVSGNFERSVRLPEFVDGDNISAEYTHGVLYLTVPKAQAARPRKIQIKGIETKRVEA